MGGGKGERGKGKRESGFISEERGKGKGESGITCRTRFFMKATHSHTHKDRGLFYLAIDKVMSKPKSNTIVPCKQDGWRNRGKGKGERGRWIHIRGKGEMERGT